MHKLLSTEAHAPFMRIAFPSKSTGGPDDLIAVDFVKAKFYTFVDVDMEKKEIGDFEVVEIPFEPGEPGDVALFLKEHEGEMFILKEMHPILKDFFSRMGIKVLTGISGKIGDVLEAFLKGEIHKIIEGENY
jgi:predicted Fe-Mo cluster-binding NifX family protein